MKYNLKSDINKLKEMFPSVSEVFEPEYLEQLEPGKTMINEHEFCIKTSYNMRPLNEQFFESHRDYIDIHITLKGLELFAYTPIQELDIVSEYDQEGDCILYDKNSLIKELKSSTEGNVLVFGVEDGHMTAIGDSEDNVEKVIVKVLVENLNA